MTCKINADTSDGLKIVSDTSGIVEIQNNGTTIITSQQPAFSAYQSSAQTGVSNETWTKITLDTENFDTDSKFASSRFTPTVAGYYQIGGGIQVPTTTATHFLCGAIYKNGANAFQFTLSEGASAFYPTTTGSTVLYLDADDYVEMYVFGNIGGGTFDINVGAISTHFEGAYLRS